MERPLTPMNPYIEDREDEGCKFKFKIGNNFPPEATSRYSRTYTSENTAAQMKGMS